MPLGQRGDPPSAIRHGLLDRLLGYHLRRAQIEAFACFDGAMAQKGISPGQFGALALIQANPGLKQSELGRELGIEPSSVAVLLDRLQRKGWIARGRASGDRRASALRLTAAGERLFRALRPQIVRQDRRLADGLSAHETRRLIALLARLHRRGSQR